MNTSRLFISSALAATLIALSGCAVTRGQETVGAYVDDTAITTSVKARFVDNRDVDAASIKVETLNGTVMLSGFAKNGTERTPVTLRAMTSAVSRSLMFLANPESITEPLRVSTLMLEASTSWLSTNRALTLVVIAASST